MYKTKMKVTFAFLFEENSKNVDLTCDGKLTAVEMIW